MSHTSAAHAVAEFLKTPDDLAKISVYRKKIVKEKASLEGRLTSGAKAQLDATREALLRLHDSRVAVGHVREEMVNIERTCEDPQLRIKGFDRIGEITQTHRNMKSTVEMVDNLRTLDSKLDYIDQLIAQDSANPTGSAPNLLLIHFRLSQLETFRNETMLRAQRSSNETRQKLEQMFSRVQTTMETFEKYYLQLASTLVDIVRAGNPSVAVKVAKIAELEGQRDEKAIAIRIVRKKNTQVAAHFGSVQAEARTIKHYRSKVIDTIRESCKTAIQNAYSKHGANVWSHLRFIYEDLILVEDSLAPLFPPDWKVYTVWIKAYQQALYEFCQQVTSKDADAGFLLEVVRFVKSHTKNMTKELDIPEELLVPKLLDGKEQDLIEDYVKLIVKKMEEWTDNLKNTETGEFVERANPPEEDKDGMFGMQGAVILFQMINQQCDMAAESGQGAVLTRVVEEANRIMHDIQNSWITLLDKELRRHSDKKEDSPGGLAEYTIALANDQVKSADYVETLLARLEPLVSEKYRRVINEKLNDAMDGFLDVAKKCIEVLINLIFHDVSPAVKILFTSSWYNEEPMTQIVETLRDYMTDYQSHLHSSLFDLLIEDIIDMFLVTYLGALRKSSKLKVKSGAAPERIRQDVRLSFGFFTTYKSPKELEAYFDVIDCILKVVSASKTMFFLDYWPFAKKYGANVNYIESILKARDDLDRQEVRDIMDGVRKKVKDDALEDPPGPTIFSRLPTK